MNIANKSPTSVDCLSVGNLHSRKFLSLEKNPFEIHGVKIKPLKSKS